MLQKRNPSSSRPTSDTIQCQRNATLIIFGQQLKLVPKRPLPPSGFKLEQMLAIGLINHLFTPSGKLKNTQIIFYWFLSPSVSELLEWIIAFQNSLLLPNPKSAANATVSSMIDLAEAERFANSQAAATTLFGLGEPSQLDQSANVITSQPTLLPTGAAVSGGLPIDPTIRCASNVRASSQSLPTVQSMLDSTPSHPRSQQDDLSLGLLMANTQSYLNSIVPGLAAAGAAGMLTSASQMAASDQLLSAMTPSTLAALQANAANELFVADPSNFGNTMAVQTMAPESIPDPNAGAGTATQMSGNFASLTGFNGMLAPNFTHTNSSSADIEFENGLDCFDNPIEFSALNIV